MPDQQTNPPAFSREEAAAFFDAWGGFSFSETMLKPAGNGWQLNTRSNLATFDTDLLTTLVFLAHRLCMRVSVEPCNFDTLTIVLHKRHARTGSMWARHPSLAQGVAIFEARTKAREVLASE